MIQRRHNKWNYRSRNYWSQDRKIWRMEFRCQKRLWSNLKKILSYLCSRASFEEKKEVNGITIYLGECLTSEEKITEVLNFDLPEKDYVTRDQVNYLLRILEKEHKILRRKIHKRLYAYKVLDILVFQQANRESPQTNPQEFDGRVHTNKTVNTLELEDRYSDLEEITLPYEQNNN